MGKFLDLMSQNDSSTLRKRATVINTQAELAQKNLINALEGEKTKVELKIEQLTDFAPDNTQSLRPGTQSWDPAKWAVELQNAKLELNEINLQLAEARETYKDFFGETTSETQIIEAREV